LGIAAPEPIADSHELAAFDSGVPSLDDWLRRRARGNQSSGATRTFVVAEHHRVIAYYAIASGAISVSGAPGRFRRNMPETCDMVGCGIGYIFLPDEGRGS
jgi:hypothetical protein